MESVGAPLLHCSDMEFDKRISSMEAKSLLETITFLQKEMASEQARFDDMTSRLGQIPDAESPEYETLSAELMAVQANLASLMARNMKCFNQQTSGQNRDQSDDTSSLNGTGSSEVELRNGDSVRLLNGHKKHRKVSPRLNRKPHRRPSYDDGEPDVAGYEESQGSGEEQNGNGNFLSLEFGSGGNGLLHVRGRRDFHSPDAQQQFIDFGPLGETSTDDDLVTVEKNKKNEQNEARLDDREQLEQKALRDLESLMRFDGDPQPAPSDPSPPRPAAHNKHPGRLFYIDNVTQGESYTDVEHTYKEIDVDRIGEEDEGEEDDPSEWKYAGDGDNKIPDGPIIHNSSGATAKIFAESLVRRRRLTDDDDVSDVTADKNDNDVYDVKRSTVTMVLRSGGDESSVSNGAVVNGSSKSRPEVTTMTSSAVVTLQSAHVPLAAATSAKIVPSNGHHGGAGSDEGTTGGLGVTVSDSEQVGSGAGAAHEAVSDLSEGVPTTATPVSTDVQLQDGGQDQNTPPPAPTTDSTPGISSSTGGSSDTSLTDSSRGAEHTCRVEEQEQVPVVATSRVTLTLSPVPRPAPVPEPTDTDPDPGRHPLLHAARVSLRTVSASNRPLVRTAPQQEQEEAGPKDGPEYSSTTSSSVSTAKVHFRSYASFAPSEAGDDDQGDVGDADDLTDDLTDAPAPTQDTADDMGNALDGAKEADSVSVKSAVTPACLPSEGFTADDKVKERTTLKDWDPTKLMQELYKIQLVPEENEDFFEHITMEGYMEKLPINKKKATLLKTWKRRFFKAQEGYLYYYEPPDTVRPKTDDGKDSDKPSGSIQLMGGSIETLDNRMIGIDDGRGRYLVVRAPTDADCEDWRRALTSQTIENIKASWVKPVVHAIPSRRRNVVIIDIGSCSVRAGVLGENPSLPSLFFPCIMATSKDTGDRVFGFEALLPESRANCTLSYPVRPSVKVDKFAVDMAAMPELFDKIFNDLNVDPSKHWVMFSAPGNFSDKIKQHFMDILVNRFHVIGVNIVAQTLLSLYSYNSRSGIVVDVGERLEIVPVTDGYIVEAGVTRQPYGGHRITEALNSSFTESKYRFFTDVEFQIVRLAMEKSCYVAPDYNAENRKCQQNPRPFKKTIHLEQFGLPSGTWKNVTHTQSRFSTTEGLFNTEMWGMDNPMMHKLVAKAVQVCPMDMRREIWRSIFLSGGVTLLPGFAERLQEELTKLAPPSVKVQVHASPQRYHSAFIGACALANLQEFEQACISADEWRENGLPCLRKWHMY